MEVANCDRLSQQTSEVLSQFGEITPKGSESVIQDYFIRNHDFFDEDYDNDSSNISDIKPGNKCEYNVKTIFLVKLN